MQRNVTMISCAIEEHSLACLLTYLFNYLLTYLLYRCGCTTRRRLVRTRAAWPDSGSPSCFRRSTTTHRRSSATSTASTTRTIPAPSSCSPARPSTSWCRAPATRPPRQAAGGSASPGPGRGMTSGTTSVTSSNHDDDDGAFILIFFVCALRFLTLPIFTVTVTLVAGDYSTVWILVPPSSE